MAQRKRHLEGACRGNDPRAGNYPVRIGPRSTIPEMVLTVEGQNDAANSMGRTH